MNKQLYSVMVYKDGTFGFTINGGGLRKRKNVKDLFIRIKNKMLALSKGRCNVRTQNEIMVRVYEDRSLSNSGTYTDKKEALYAMSCFLENYLPKSTLKRVYKNYFGRSMIRDLC